MLLAILSYNFLAVLLSEMIVASNDLLGADIHIDTNLLDLELLFGECGSVIVVSLNKNKLHELVLLATKYDIFTQTIGIVNNNGILKINDLIKITKNKLYDTYYNSFSR